MSAPRLAVLASGRGSNYAALAAAVERGDLTADIVLVLTDVAGAPVLELAGERGTPTEVLGPAAGVGAGGSYSRARYGAALAAMLERYHVQYVALAGFMRMLGGEVLSRYAGRIVNVHPSLLPAFPGLDAQKQALAHGVKVSGCTVHLVNEGMDTGPILAQQAVPVLADDSVDTLTQRIQAAEHDLYWRALNELLLVAAPLAGHRPTTEGSGTT